MRGFITQFGDLDAARDRWSALPVTITGPLGDARRLILALLAENAELRAEVERVTAASVEAYRRICTERTIGRETTRAIDDDERRATDW